MNSKLTVIGFQKYNISFRVMLNILVRIKIMSFPELLLLIVFCATFKEAMGFNYCDIEGCNPNTHTLCKYPRGEPDCHLDVRGLTNEQRETLLRVHNELRQKVALGKEENQPPASNMMELEWNDEAAMIAQRWVERCMMFYDACWKLRDGDFQQNGLGITVNINTYNRADTVAKITQVWYDYVKYMNSDEVSELTTIMGTGGISFRTYTTVVNAKTTQIGCGYIEKPFSGVVRDANLFCNYSPGGNVIGAPVYKQGKACTACPEGSFCSVRYPGLCTTSFDYCNIEGCKPNTHPLCIYPEGKPDCIVDTMGLNDEQKETLLRMHNEMRQKLALGKEGNLPPASNMMELEWNEEAAKIAQRWTERCNPRKFNPCPRLRDAAALQWGIGYYRIVKTTNISGVIANAMNFYYEKAKHYDPNGMKNFTSFSSADGKQTYEAYIAMIYSKSTQIGCGFIEMPLYSDGFKDMYLFCNLSPFDAVIGAPVYKEGKACTACPKGSVCSIRYPGLCTSKTARLQPIIYSICVVALRAVFKTFN